MNDTYSEHGIICPHCGYENTDAWEWHSDESDCTESYECGNCGEISTVTKYTTVSYAAEKKEKPYA